MSFRLKLKPGHKVPAPLEAFLLERPNKEKPLHSRDTNSFTDSGRVQHCHAFLQAFQKAPAATNTFASPDKNYVVIGRGFAATTNLATLRSKYGKGRIGQMNLIVIGHDDPWSVYVQHNMNQEVELLTLPGYAGRPGLPEAVAGSRWLDSREFARCNQAELERAIGAKHPAWPKLQQLRASVRWIEKVVEKGVERYRLHFEGRKPIMARTVDVCTGTGAQTYAEAGGERGLKMPDTLWNEYLHPQLKPVDGKARLMSAEMYVAGDRQVIPGGAVLITSANSPAGIQAGEHALCEDGDGSGVNAAAEVVLIASETMNGGFPPIGRLDHHARTAAGALPVRLHHPLAEPLFPTRDKVWFGEKYRVRSIEVLNKAHREAFCHGDDTAISAAGDGRQLFVTLAPAGGARFVRGCPLPQVPAAPEADLVYGLFDQVVISTGRARGGRAMTAEKEEGSAMQLLYSMRNELEVLHVPGYDFPVGLQTPSGRLRVLGAAGLNNPIFRAGDPGKKLKAFEDSLPYQARVFGEGVTLAAKTIALANRYFKLSDEDACVNTATLSELKKASQDETLARRIYWSRHWRVRPFRHHTEMLRVLEYRSNILGEYEVIPAELGKNLGRGQILGVVGDLNDTARLMDDERWAELWNAEWVHLTHAEEVDKLLLRYAHSINDAASRSKSRLE
jgi:hypothetical protein